MTFDYSKRIATKINASPVDSLLNKVSLESVFCTHSCFSAPWGVEMPSFDYCMMFHLVLTGQATIEVDNEQHVLHEGEFILLPRGVGHKLSCGNTNFFVPLEQLPIEIISDRYERLNFGGQGNQTTMLCGVITFKHPLVLRLLNILPTHILIGKNSERYDTLRSLIDLIEQETSKPGSGSAGAMARLADLLVITSLKEYLETQDSEVLDWMRALEDSRISKAIDLVHNQPSKHWNLEELSNAVGMSRTSFTSEFKRLVGTSPIEYLTEWRMSLAYGDLQNTQEPILTIALDYGYQSESAFSRAFKRTMGLSPSAIRKQTTN